MGLISVNAKTRESLGNSPESERDYSCRTTGESVSASSVRETDVLVRLAGFGYLNSAQVEEFLFDASALTARSRAVTTHQILEGLRRRGLIAATPSLVGGPIGGSARLAYRLTDLGQRSVDALEGRAHARQPRRGTLFVSHALMAAEVALAFRRAARSRKGHELREWESDWDVAERLRPSRLVPDARLLYRSAFWEIDAFVEIDLGTERVSRFAEKMREYINAWRDGSWRGRLPSWPLTLIVTTSARRASTLRLVTEELLRSQGEAARLAKATEFDFAPLTDVLGAKGPLGQIWQIAGRDGFHGLIPEDIQAPPNNGPVGIDGASD